MVNHFIYHKYKLYFVINESYIYALWINSSPPSAACMRQRIGSDKGLSPIRRQAIILTNAALLSIGQLGKNVSEILIKIQNFHSRKCIWEYSLGDSGHYVQGEIS